MMKIWKRIFRNAYTKQVDGIVIATVCKDEKYFERILDSSIPTVFVDNLPQIKGIIIL